MELLERVRYALRSLLARGRAERELDEELRFHLERQAEAYERAGMTAADAHTAAARDFGGIERHKEDCRDARGTTAVEDPVRDLRQAWRTLRGAPALTALVVLVLGLGVGANTAIFSVVRGVLLQPLSYRDAGRIVLVHETDRISGTTSEPASIPDWIDYRDRNRVFASLAGYYAQPMSLIARGESPEQLEVALASHELFGTLGIRPQLGRAFGAEEDRPGGERVVVLSDALWRRRFGASPDILGRLIRLDDAVYTIVGVLPPRIAIPSPRTALWTPLQGGPPGAPRSNHIVSVLARLAPGVDLPRAQREMDALASQLEAQYPNVNHGRGVRLEPLPDAVLGGARPALGLLYAAVALVLLIACANAGNLLLARAIARRREIAVRVALGASDARLARAFLAESLLVALGAGALGVAIAWGGVQLLRDAAHADLPRLDEVRVDRVVLGYALGLSCLVSVVFGLLPLAESRRLDVHAALKTEQSRLASASPAQRRLRSGLVVGEVALSVVLLVVASLLLRSFWTLSHVDPGFTADRVLRASYELPTSRYPRDFRVYPHWPATQRFMREAMARVAELPGVQSVALAASHPLDPGFTNSFVIVGREAEAAQQPEIRTRAVSPSYFETMRLPLRRGRLLEPRDDDEAPAVVVINEAAAKTFFPGADPIGKRVRFWGTVREIVGVVGNEHFMGLGEATPPALYPPTAQTPTWSGTLLLRVACAPAASGCDPKRLEPLVRQAVAKVDGELALHDVRTMRETVSDSIARPRFLAALLGAFALVALALALAGVHGVLSWVVAQRTHEIGVRVALGAAPGAIVRELTAHGVALAAIGLAIGIGVALLTARFVGALLFGIGGTDAPTFVLVAAGVLAVAALASWLPARRAAGVDPMLALRAD